MNLPGTALTAADLATLADPSLAEQAYLRRVDSLTGAQLVGRNGHGDYAGIIFPYIWPGDKHVREYRLRRDTPDLEHNGTGKPHPKNKYLSPPGRSNMLYLVPGTDQAWLSDSALPIILTEGEKKGLALWSVALHELADATDKPRWLPVAIPGVWNWRGTVGKTQGPNGERQDIKGPISDLDKILWSHRRVLILFDANIRTNEGVDVARKMLARVLQRRGAVVSLLDLPDEGVNGVDDLVGIWGKGRVLQFLKDSIEGLSTIIEEFPLTELGNAERLIRDCDSKARYSHEFKKWFVYDGVRYCPDSSGEMERRCKRMVRSIPLEAAAYSERSAKLDRDSTVDGISDEKKKKLAEEASKAADKAKRIRKWAVQSESAAGIRNAISLAQSELGVPVLASELDIDPWLLNVLNGVLDLSTGELLPHSPDRFITKLAPVRFDPGAKCDLFTKYLAEVFPKPYDDTIPFLQRAVGYSLTGVTREECLFVNYGTGRNGKGTLMKLLQALLGDYAGTADFSSFVPRRDDAIREDIAAMFGKRFIGAQETKEGAVFAESVIKALTGGDMVRARRLHENGFEFQPIMKIWLAVNHKPEIRGTDIGIWSRIRLLPFTVSFEGREDKKLKDELLKELPGILNWALRGCRDWQETGLGTCGSVAAANEEYRAECDQLKRFLDDRCEEGMYFTVGAGELFNEYKKWCGHGGEEFITLTAFGKRMKERGFEKKKESRGFIYQKIKLIKSVPQQPDNEESEIHAHSA